MMGNYIKIKNKAEVYFHGPMAENMMGNGKQE